MSVLKSLRQLARYNVLTPIAILAVAVPGVANAAGELEIPLAVSVLNGVDLQTYDANAPYDALKNLGSITNSSGNVAVFSNLPLLSVRNVGGTISGNNAPALIVNFNNGNFVSPGTLALGTFSNTGTITSNDGDTTIGINGKTSSFTNSSIISNTGNGRAIGGGDFDEFVNNGSITALTQTAVEAFGAVGSFSNNLNAIISGNRGVVIDGATTLFSNAGTITGTNNQGVEFNSAVTSFKNLIGGTITGNGNGVRFGGLVSTFSNAGTIKGGVNGDDAVDLGNGVTNFTNDTGALIQSLRAGNGGGGKAVGVNIDLSNNGAAVTSFINRGTIQGGMADVPTNQDATINFYTNNHPAQAALVSSFWNYGNILGYGTGVNVDGDKTHGGIATFVNTSGATITSTQNNAVSANGLVGSFTNAGTINGAGYQVLNFNAGVMNFLNDTNGTIKNTDSTVYFGGQGGGAVRVNTDTGTGNAVTNFTNLGSIMAASVQDPSNYQTTIQFSRDTDVGHAGRTEVAATLDTFFNGGTISGPGRAIGFDGTVTNFTNTKTITGAGYQTLSFDGGVTNFLNEVGGLIQNTDRTHVNNPGDNGGGAIQINADAGGGGSALTSFVNRGTILGATDATDNVININAFSAQTISLFQNDGKISGNVNAVAINGIAVVANFVNTGEITAKLDASNSGAWGVAVNYKATVFTNSGLISGPAGGISVIGLGTLNNTATGRIIATGNMAFPFEANGVIAGDSGFATINNAGYIAGADLGSALALYSGGHVINSGTLQGAGRGAIVFDDVYSTTDDKLTILTGSKIFGELNFTGGNDTLDFAGFMGNTVLDVKSLNTLVAGSRSYFDFRDGNGDGKVAIIDISGLGGKVVGQTYLDLVLGLNNAIPDDLDGSDEEEEPLQFAPTAPKTAAVAALDTAVLTELDTLQKTGVKVWGGFLGGGSSRTLPVDQASIYGGVVLGSHARLNETFKAGALGGYVVTNTSTQGGQQTLATQTGALGAYGSASFGVADIDFSLIGGLSAHTSKRQVIANNQVQTATGLFTSMFIAPSAAVTVPVLANEAGELAIKASATYVAGLTSAYTETGSAMNLAVGAQTISIFDARVGLEGRHDIGSAQGTSASLTAKGGVFAQVNGGSATVPVTTLGQTINVSTPGGSAFGVYGGVGLEAQLNEQVDLDINVDGAFRSDGLASLSLKGTLGGQF